MRQDPFGRQRQQQAAPRRGFNPRILILIAFIAYGAYYWFSNQTVDPVTGEKVLIDRSLSVEDEKALGLQAYEEILSQERPVRPDAPISQEIREIARRLIAKVPEVEAALAAENGQQPTGFSSSFEWDVNVIESDQATPSACPAARWRSIPAWCRWPRTRTRWRW